MKRVLIDTNGYLRFLLDDLPEQAKKVAEVLTQAQTGQLEIVLPPIVVFELIFVLEKYYQFPKDQVITQLKSLVLTPYLLVEDRGVLLEALDMYQQQQLSFVDCYLVQKCKLEQMNLMTFDQAMKKVIQG